MKLTENSKKILTFLQGLKDTDNVTSANVAEALGIEDKRVVDGVFNSLVGKELAFRDKAQVEVTEVKTINFLRLTDAGKAIDLNAEDAE